MPKPDLQQELLEKVKPGTKPSHLKKLKRSKSADDIPQAPPLQSTPLTRSQSNQPFTDPQYPYTTLISQQEELDRLQKETTAKSATISLLRKKIEELEKNNPPQQLLQDQLQEKQQQIEELRKQLEVKPLELSELDQSLLARHKSLKDWFTQYSKNKDLEKELKENIDEAATELISQDKTISQLRNQINHLKLTNQSLQKDLNLAHRAVEWRKNPFPNPDKGTYLKYGLYACLALGFIFLLNGSWKTNFKDN